MLGIGGHAFGASDGVGVSGGLHRLADAGWAAGSGGEPGQCEGAGPDRGDVVVGECHQRVGGRERVTEGWHGLGGTVEFEQGYPFRQPPVHLHIE